MILWGSPQLPAWRVGPSVVGIGRLAYHTFQLARPADGWSRLSQLNARARAACDELSRQGTRVRFLRSIFVPEDEACFHLYEAVSVEAVRQAARQAGLDYARVLDATPNPQGER